MNYRERINKENESKALKKKKRITKKNQIGMKIYGEQLVNNIRCLTSHGQYLEVNEKRHIHTQCYRNLIVHI